MVRRIKDSYNFNDYTVRDNKGIEYVSDEEAQEDKDDSPSSIFSNHDRYVVCRVSSSYITFVDKNNPYNMSISFTNDDDYSSQTYVSNPNILKITRVEDARKLRDRLNKSSSRHDWKVMKISW